MVRPKRLGAPIVIGHNSEGYLEVSDGFLAAALGTVYFAKDVVAKAAMVDRLFSGRRAMAWDFFCSNNLVVLKKQLS